MEENGAWKSNQVLFPDSKLPRVATEDEHSPEGSATHYGALLSKWPPGSHWNDIKPIMYVRCTSGDDGAFSFLLPQVRDHPFRAQVHQPSSDRRVATLPFEHPQVPSRICSNDEVCINLWAAQSTESSVEQQLLLFYFSHFQFYSRVSILLSSVAGTDLTMGSCATPPSHTEQGKRHP